MIIRRRYSSRPKILQSRRSTPRWMWPRRKPSPRSPAAAAGAPSAGCRRGRGPEALEALRRGVVDHRPASPPGLSRGPRPPFGQQKSDFATLMPPIDLGKVAGADEVMIARQLDRPVTGAAGSHILDLGGHHCCTTSGSSISVESQWAITTGSLKIGYSTTQSEVSIGRSTPGVRFSRNHGTWTGEAGFLAMARRPLDASGPPRPKRRTQAD